MADQPRSYPIPRLRFAARRWRIRWNVREKSYEFSTGYQRAEKDKAEVACQYIAIGLRGEKFPEWAEHIPAVIAYQKTLADQFVSGEKYFRITSATAQQAWINQYAATAKVKQIKRRAHCLGRLAEKYDLLTLTSAQAAEWIETLAINRYLSDTVRRLMNGRAMTRKEIAAALVAANIEHTSAKLSIALGNRAIFEFTPKPTQKRGKYRATASPRTVSPNTTNIYIETAKMFYKWAVKNKLVKENPFDDIKKKSVSKTAEIVFLLAKNAMT
ncbi:hypothetical protein AGMMS49959_04600 [Planctomycetales bacterium]|nr:hypothetical protein AGMMS49959_04600 [Planctomycetales bacterium]